MEFGKPKLPTLPKLPSLAFWKKGEDSEIPPPPARHFDPSRFGGETQIAAQAKSHQSEFDEYGMRVKDSAKEASNLASKGFSFPKESVEKLNAKPMRKPYGLDDLGGDEMLVKADNKFNLDATNLKNKFDDAKSTASNQLSSAQQDFRSAMNSADSFKATAKSSLSSVDNSFASGDNSFAADPIAKTIDSAKSFGNVSGGSFSPQSNAFGNVKQVSAESVAAVNKSLYDAKGQLTSATSGFGGQAQDFAQSNANSMKTQFEQRLLAAQKQAEVKSDAIQSGASKASDQLNALANVSERTQDLINKPFPKVNVDGSFIPPSSARPVDLNASLPALQPDSNPLLQISKPNALATNSFGVTPNPSSDAVSQMRSEVVEAKRQIAMLKAQVAAAKQSAVAATEPIQRVAQNTIEGVVLPLNENKGAYDSQAGTPVASQYQTQPYSPAASQTRTPITPITNPNTGGSPNSFYPATPYGGFGSNSKPEAAVGQVGFNSNNDSQNRVSQASVEEPASIYSGPLQANRIDNTATEVLIPSSILSGNSSFAPGSTNPLR